MTQPRRNLASTVAEASAPTDDRLAPRALARGFAALRGSELDFARRQAAWAEAREALVAENAKLETRLADQAREVDALNSQLQQRVRERSHELSKALRRLATARHSSPLIPGEVIGARVRVERVLGFGGMGTVYAGIDLASGGRVAVKVMHPDIESSVAAVRRFVEEADATAQISHRGVVKTLHLDIEPDGRIYQIMEYVDGIELGGRGKAALFGSSAVARIGAGLARALSAAHAAGIVHRDVKPGNVMLCSSPPGVRVLDFGISKRLHPDGVGGGASITRGTDFVGTPRYASPEQIGHSRAVQQASDVYSMGVVLYELLSGRLPFADAVDTDLLVAHLRSEPTDLGILVPQAPTLLVGLISACMSKTPDARPTAAELACALDALADAAGAPSVEDIAAKEVQRAGAQSRHTTRQDA